MSLVVSELFGPTVQGEGPYAGQRCGFLRLGRCNLNCTWCDTPYTWDWKGANGTAYDPHVELDSHTLYELCTQLRAMHVPVVVATGGEPLLQRTHLATLAHQLAGYGIAMDVETNGTLPPGALEGVVRQWVLSPKLANSGIPTDKRLVPAVLEHFVEDTNAIFKFVATAPDDLVEIDRVVRAHRVPADRVWVMPEGRTPAALAAGMAAIADGVVAAGWNLTGRMHVLAWGDVRGR